MSSDKEDKKEKPPAYLKEDPAEVVTRAFAGDGKQAFVALLEAGIKEDTLRTADPRYGPCPAQRPLLRLKKPKKGQWQTLRERARTA
jgi:hypothetical protein